MDENIWLFIYSNTFHQRRLKKLSEEYYSLKIKSLFNLIIIKSSNFEAQIDETFANYQIICQFMTYILSKIHLIKKLVNPSKSCYIHNEVGKITNGIHSLKMCLPFSVSSKFLQNFQFAAFIQYHIFWKKEYDNFSRCPLALT